MKDKTSLPIHEGVVLRALVALYKESASSLAQKLDIKLNRLNYLYKMEQLPEGEIAQILNYLNRHENEWHKQEIETLHFFAVFQQYLQQPNGKKNAENIITGSGNNMALDNSSITNSSENEEAKKRLRGLIDQVKQQQREINELKEEKRTLLKTNKTLATIQEKTLGKLFKLINK